MLFKVVSIIYYSKCLTVAYRAHHTLAIEEYQYRSISLYLFSYTYIIQCINIFYFNFILDLPLCNIHYW